MKIENTSVVMDTYAWIEYFRGTKKGEVVKDYLLSAKNIYTPSIVLAEISRKYIRENVSEDIVKHRLKVVEEISLIIDINVELALEAGKVYLELLDVSRKRGLKQKPSLNDAIILAVARKLRAKIITGDQHFRHLKETIWIGD